MSRITSLVLAIAAFALPALAQSPDVAVRDLLNSYSTALSNKDANTVASLYTEDAYLLAPKRPMIKGRGAILEFWKQNMGGKLTLTPVAIQAHGDAAVVVGTFSFDDNPPGGKFSATVINKNGKWLLAVDMWNSDTN